MSGKTAKALRKLAKKELEEIKKNMNPNQPQKQQLSILNELDQLLFSLELLTGEKPASIALTDPMYNMYVQVVNNNAEALGLNPGFRTPEPIFKGVKLIRKSPLIVPTPSSTPVIETPKTN